MLTFNTLYDVLAAWPPPALPTAGSDGVFDRIRQILEGAIAGGGKVGMGDLMPLLRHVLRRHSRQTMTMGAVTRAGDGRMAGP